MVVFNFDNQHAWYNKYMDLFSYVACVFGTYGISQIITKYDGLMNIFLRLREKLPAFECYVCTSVWVAATLTFLKYLPSPFHWSILFWIPAVIGGSFIVHKVLDD